MNWLTGLGSALGGLFGLGGSAMGAKAAQKAVQEQNKGNMELAKYQYQQNLEQWNRENEYNTPTAQMERLKAAGLNPNLMYGDTSAGGSAASSPTFQAPHLSAYTNQASDYRAVGQQFGQMFENYINMETKQHQNELLKRQAESVQTDTLNKQIEGAILAKNNDLKGLEYQLMKNSFEDVLRLRKANADNAEAEYGNKLTYRNLMAAQIENYDNLGKRLAKQSELTDAQIQHTLKQVDVLNYDIALKVETLIGKKLTNTQLKNVNAALVESLYWDNRTKHVRCNIEQLKETFLREFGTDKPLDALSNVGGYIGLAGYQTWRFNQ